MSCFFHSMYLPWLSSHKCHTRQQDSDVVCTSCNIQFLTLGPFQLPCFLSEFPLKYPEEDRMAWFCMLGR